MPTVTVNDIEMYYEQHGEGDDVLLITGLNANHLMWVNVLPLLTQHYRITFIDNRGAGLTSISQGPYTIKQMADDTAGLMDAIGLTQAHVVGHSMGGAIAQQLAIHYPEKIKKLILYATAAKFDARGLYTLNQGIALREQGKSSEQIARVIDLPWCFSKQFIANKTNLDNFFKLVTTTPYPMDLEASKAQTAACMTHDTRELLGKIQAWTMVIGPEQDIITPPSDSLYMAARIPNARIIEIKDYAHCWHLEAPEYFANQVHLYIRRKKI